MMMNEAPGPINFTMFLTLFGERLQVRRGKLSCQKENLFRTSFFCFSDSDPESSSRQLSSNKEKKLKYHVWTIPCWAGGFFCSLNVLYRVLRRRMTFSDKKIMVFVLKILGMASDWIRIHHQPSSGSGSGFSKMSGSGSLFRKSGYETLRKSTKFCIWRAWGF